MSSSMYQEWPDAIRCNTDSEEAIFYLVKYDADNNQFYYRKPSNGLNYNIRFNIDGTYAGRDNAGATGCDDKSVTELKDAGQAQHWTTCERISYLKKVHLGVPKSHQKPVFQVKISRSLRSQPT